MSIRDHTHIRSSQPTDDGVPKPTRPGRPRQVLAAGRNIWRQLTSMRTALVLLFLLALASLPGALLPQWSLNSGKTVRYILDHPTLGPLLNRLGFFQVFASPWYASIYLLLFISLVGCLLPRSWEFVGQLRRPPVGCPRNLSRLPHYTRLSVADEPVTVADRIETGLRRGVFRWRTVRRTEAGFAITVSAEKGYLREVGNLLFHLSLLGLLISVAVGKLAGYEGSVLVTAGPNQGFCNSSPIAYDDFRPGLLVDGAALSPFCVDVDAFTATYTPTGQANTFDAQIRYQSGSAAGTDQWQRRALKVNDPLRLPAGERIYLLGHGFTPTFTLTFPDGTVRDYAQPFEPLDSMFTSQGAVKITDPPGYTGLAARTHQLAIVGIFAPTAVIQQGIMSSSFPAALNPGAAVQVYRGDLGMATGRPQSVFAIDTNQVATGALVKVGSANLTPGHSMTIGDGTKITFDGFREFVSLQTSYDPAQGYALIFVVLLLIGLMLSLGIKRRRIWFRLPLPGEAERLTVADDTAGPAARSTGPPTVTTAAFSESTVQVGGLARTDQAGYGEEFDRIAALALPAAARQLRAHDKKGDQPWQ